MSHDSQRPSRQKSKMDTSASLTLTSSMPQPPVTNAGQTGCDSMMGSFSDQQKALDVLLSQMDRGTSQRVLRQLFAASERKQTTEHDVEEIQPIALQDPPKPKFKRQLSSDSRDESQSKAGEGIIRSDMQYVTSSPQSGGGFKVLSTRPPPQSPQMTSSTSQPRLHDNIIPMTPPPEKANCRFSFESAVMSPKRLKPDTVSSGFRMNNQTAPKNPQKSVFVFPEVSRVYNEKHDERSRMPLYSRTVYNNPNLDEESVFSERDIMAQYDWNRPNSNTIQCSLPPWGTHKTSEAHVSDYMDCVPSPSISLPRQQTFGCCPQRNLTFDYPASVQHPNSKPNLGYDLPSPDSEMLTALLSRLSPQKERRQPLRSQSNVDHSPSKEELHQMQQHKFPRSMSKPEGPLTKSQMQRWLHHYKYVGPHSSSSASFSRPSFPRQQVDRQMSESVEQQQDMYAVDHESAETDNIRRHLFAEDSSATIENYFKNEKMQQSPFVSADSPEIASFDPGDDVRYDVYIIPRDASQSASSVEEQLLLKAGSAFSHPETHSRRQSTSNDGDVVRSFFLRNQGSGSSPAKRQQPKKGDIDIRIRCQEIIHSQSKISERLQQIHRSKDKTCACEAVEANILRLATEAFAKVRRKSEKPEDHELYQTEVTKTNERILEALGIGMKLKELCAHNRMVKDLFTGSVVITLNCPTLGALQSLWDVYKTGQLKVMFTQELVTRKLKDCLRVKDIWLSVLIEQSAFNKCWEGLEKNILQVRKLECRQSTSGSKLSPFKREVKSTEYLETIPSSPTIVSIPVRCSSTPVLAVRSPLSSPSSRSRSPATPTRRERKFSFSFTGEQSQRRVFQQRNFGEVPSSPTKRFLQEAQWTVYQSTSSPRSPMSPKSPKFKRSLENISDDQENTLPSA